MTPPETLSSAVWISVLVRVLMMLAMVGHPVDWPAFYTERTQDGKSIFHGSRTLERAMGEKAVVAHTDPQRPANPVEQQADAERCPTEMPQGSDCSGVDSHYECSLKGSEPVSNWNRWRWSQNCGSGAH